MTPPSASGTAVALESLRRLDPSHRESRTGGALATPENHHLLRYVASDAFVHLFPGGSSSVDEQSFFADLDAALSQAAVYHLWALVPLCRYRCHFCQFPTLVLPRDRDGAERTAARWVDAGINEARRWLERVPALARTPVGEFCLFGGTPTALPADQLERLLGFYREAFNFDEGTSLRVEGSPDTLTPSRLELLGRLGCSAVTYGIESFDDGLLRVANRGHTGEQARRVVADARRAGIERVDGDLIWGLPGQTVDGFVADVDTMIDLGFDTVAIMKLHLRSFHDVDTATGHVRPAAWEDPARRARLTERGFRWPSLGEQYQMREAAEERLAAAGHYEHPATYFPTRQAGPKRWRALNLDQDKQYPQVGIGLGGYAWSDSGEATLTSDPRRYLDALEGGRIPIEAISRFRLEDVEVRSVRMALSTCQPLSEAEHTRRFPGGSLFRGPLADAFASLERRGLATTDPAGGTVALTATGRALVEAVISTEL